MGGTMLLLIDVIDFLKCAVYACRIAVFIP